METSKDPSRERRQSRKSYRWGWAFFRRRWFLKLLLVLAPLVTKVIELAIVILKQPK